MALFARAARNERTSARAHRAPSISPSPHRRTRAEGPTQAESKTFAQLLSRFGLHRLPRHGRKLAAEVVFRHGCALLDLNERLVAGDVAPGGATAARAQLLREWASASLPSLVHFANDSLTLQLSEMFQHLHDLDAGDAAAPPLAAALPLPPAATAAGKPALGPSTHTNPAPTLEFSVRVARADAAAATGAEFRRQLQARLGFALWLGPSQAPAGPHASGVYLRGRAEAGAAVALFPGAVFSEEMLRKGVDAGHLGDPRVPRALVPRLDGAVLDVHAPTGAGEGNPFALAHHVRHPPEGVAPNVMRLQVDFLRAEGGAGATGSPLLPFPAHLRGYIPNVWGSEVGVGQALYGALEEHVFMKGSVLVATRPLWDEELFVDHTLNPFAAAAGLIPPWARARWAENREARRLAGRVSRDTENATIAAFAAEVEGVPQAPSSPPLPPAGRAPRQLRFSKLVPRGAPAGIEK